MNLFIPELGTKLRLLRPWEFKVINEARNLSIAKLLEVQSPTNRYPLGAVQGRSYFYTSQSRSVSGKWVSEECEEKSFEPERKTSYTYTFPIETILTVDRIYIRKGAKDFSSVSFLTQVGGKRVRFFARLVDVNNLVVEVVT